MEIGSSHVTNKCHSSKKGSQGKPNITVSLIITATLLSQSGKDTPRFWTPNPKQVIQMLLLFIIVSPYFTLFLVQLLPIICTENISSLFVVLRGWAVKPALWQKAKLNISLFLLLQIRKLRIS